MRIQHGRKKPRAPPVTLEAARDNDFAFDRQAYTPPVVHRLGAGSRSRSKRCVITSTDAFMTCRCRKCNSRILEDEVVGA